MIITDPTKFIDSVGIEQQYRRLGSFIEFSGEAPPKGIIISPKTLKEVQQGVQERTYDYIAKVVNWEANVVSEECLFSNEMVALKAKGSNIKHDTHAMCKVSNKLTVTIPITGKYRVYYEKEFQKGDAIELQDTDKLNVERKV